MRKNKKPHVHEWKKQIEDETGGIVACTKEGCNKSVYLTHDDMQIFKQYKREGLPIVMESDSVNKN